MEPHLFARFTKEDTDVNASMSPEEYNLQFVRTSANKSAILAYVQEAKAKMDPKSEHIKYKKNEHKKIVHPKELQSYKNAHKVKLDSRILEGFFKLRVPGPTVNALCDVRISPKRGVAEVTLRISPSDVLPVCKFSTEIAEHAQVLPGLTFFSFAMIYGI